MRLNTLTQNHRFLALVEPTSAMGGGGVGGGYKFVVSFALVCNLIRAFCE